MSRPLKKSLLLWTRTLHIYGSMAALLTILFFASTGFLLNHPTWFSLDKSLVDDREFMVPEDVAGTEDKLAIVEYLRAHESARGEVKAFTRNDDQTTVDFTSPARAMQYTITRASGEAAVHVETRNALAFVTDLHMAQHTGRAWSLVVDATAWGLILASVSGLVLWLSLAKRRTLGLIALGASVAIVVGVVVWVTR